MMDGEGGVSTRLTFLGADTATVVCTVSALPTPVVYHAQEPGVLLQTLSEPPRFAPRVCAQLAWSPDGSQVLFASTARQSMPHQHGVWRVPANGGDATPLDVGPASSLCFQPGGGGRLLGRHTDDVATAQWKGYRGGAAAQLWLQTAHHFEQLKVPTGACPASSRRGRCTGRRGGRCTRRRRGRCTGSCC